MVRFTAIRGIQIRDEVAGDGLAKDVNGNFKINLGTSNPGLAITDDKLDVKLKADTGLSKDEDGIYVLIEANEGVTVGASGLAVDYDDATIGIVSTKLAVKDGGIAEAKLDIYNSPTDDYVLTWNASEGKMEWVVSSAPGETYLQEADIVKQDESALCNSIETEFTLDNTPVADSVQVYLNGSLMAEGSGRDYTLSGTTITFAIAPDTDDVLIIHYVKD